MRKLIMICGTSRSGSTMLDLMLGNAPDAFSCGEVFALFRPHAKHHYTTIKQVRKNPESIWSKVVDIPERQFHKKLFEVTKANYVIDSSKEVCWVLDTQRWAEKNQIEVINLIIWKDPIDLAHSYWKRGHHASYWKQQFVGYHNRIFSAGIPYISINYNLLAKSPQEMLSQLCKKLSIPYYQGMEHFWETEHNHVFGSTGTSEQVKKKQSSIQDHQAVTDDFVKNHHKKVTTEIATSEEVQLILEKLHQSDFRNQFNSQDSNIQNYSRIFYPNWYYLRRARTFLHGTYSRLI